MADEGRHEPVVILAPAGRDAAIGMAILEEVGIPSNVCTDLDSLVDCLEKAGGAILAEEALLRADRHRLAEWIAAQPPWSDFPFVLLTHRAEPVDPRLTDLLGNVTLLERPFRPATLANAVRSAVRARRRQREAEAYLEERRLTAERQALLIRELHHRVKNTLATVQALMGATARSSATIDEFYEAFGARIISLAKTHTLLTEDYWQTASLREMLTNELGFYDDDNGQRISLQGPPIDLPSELAVPMGMAIHELTTNAAKYGALSGRGGRVDVTWDVTVNSNSRTLSLDWIERGGPPVTPPTRNGFGTTLLHRVLRTQCSAELDVRFEPTGLHFGMRAPLVEHREKTGPSAAAR
jgi:two-component sensor histidine kinase/CheY-like chemotaxis protein